MAIANNTCTAGSALPVVPIQEDLTDTIAVLLASAAASIPSQRTVHLQTHRLCRDLSLLD